MDMIIPVCTINHIRDEYTTHTHSLSLSRSLFPLPIRSNTTQFSAPSSSIIFLTSLDICVFCMEL